MTTPTPEAIKIQPWPKLFTTLSITGDDGSEIFAIVGDGTVRGTIENAGPAAQRFMDELRGMTEAIAAQAKDEALAPILALHKPFTVHPSGIGKKYCVHCWGSDGSVEWPCATVNVATYPATIEGKSE